MNIDRLRHLTRVLRAVDAMERPFDMTAWTKGTSCDSAACAGGWAARDETFNLIGLHLLNGAPAYRIHETASNKPVCYTGWTALLEFFDLCADDAHHIFDPYFYDYLPHSMFDISPQRVIDRIEKLIQTNQENARLDSI